MMGVDHIAAWMRRRRAGRRGLNPYIAGTPVFDGKLFFGRESATRRALTGLESGHLRVTGERRIGKTSFLHHLRRILDELHARAGRPSRLVYLIDEADALVDPPGLDEQWLASLVDGWSDEVRVVLAGVGRNGHGKLQALDEIELTPLTKEAGEALVRQPVAGVFDYEAGAVARILERGRLRPYLIQRLCIRSIERVRGEGRTVVRESDVDSEAGP